MIGYKKWKVLNESLGSSFIGIASPSAVGGVINNLASYSPVSEAGEQPEAEPAELSGNVDLDVKKDDEEKEEKKDKKKGKKKKCNCGCPNCCKDEDGDNDGDEVKELDVDGDKDDEVKEESGLSEFFCSCKDSKNKDGVCQKCKKNVMQESYSVENVINESLRLYCGADSNLYKVASYLSNRYKPSAELCESAKSEICEMFAKENSEKVALAKLYHGINKVK